MLFSMEISKIDQKNINNDENLPIFTFLPKEVGILFPEKPYLKRNNHPLPVKKRNPGLRAGACG